MTTLEPSSDGASLPAESEIARLANELFASPDLSAAFSAPLSSAPAAGAPSLPHAVTTGDTPKPPEPVAGVASPVAVSPQAVPGTGLGTPVAPSSPESGPITAPAPIGTEPMIATESAAPWSVVHFDATSFSAPALSIPLADTKGDPASAPDVAPYFLEYVRGPQDGSPEPSTPTTATDGAPFELRPEHVPTLAKTPTLLDPYAVRRDFPILNERVHGKRLVWLDNAATTQKPRAVIDRLSSFYERDNSNIHRAAHTLAARATDAYEGARQKVRRFLNAPSAEDIVFVRGTTEGINLVAQSWGRRNVAAGDEIVVTHLEHHANIVPWQMLAAEKGARLRVAPVDSSGQVILEEYEKLLGPKTRVVAFTQVSNALGTIVPAREMIAMAHRHGACVMLDGAQSASHMPVDVQQLDCDFFVFSGHKIFAPTGIGVVFGKRDVLAAMPPWQGGGNMIADVTFERTLYQPPPARFEAGTGNIADAVGLGAALDYVEALGRPNIDRYEHELRVYAESCLRTIPGVRIIGTAPDKAGVISFVVDGVPTQEMGGLLDKDGIAVRSGHHCAQPILRRFGLEATVRASLAPYNTREDVEALVASVRAIQQRRG